MKIQSNMVKLVSRTAAYLLCLVVVSSQFLVNAEELSGSIKSTTPMQIVVASYKNKSQEITTGNNLWDGIIKDCLKKPSMSCFQKNVYSYLDDLLETANLNYTNRLLFMKNKVDYSVDSNEIPEAESRSATSPIEEVTNALYGKSVKFVMTHDMEVKLPEIMFDGATFRISPRAIEGNGVIAKLELIPKAEVEARGKSRLFHIKKKIQQFLRNKLLLGFLGLLIIIKIIKIKLFWLLPLIIGVGAAKKLLLKFLLFLFPALTHLFKLCSYYQQSYHSTKFHNHHHHVNHHHTIVPPWYSGDSHGITPEIIYTSPPKGAIIYEDPHSQPSHFSYDESYSPGWEASGPGLGPEYISEINRKAVVDDGGNYFKLKPEVNELQQWPVATPRPPQTAVRGTSYNNPFNYRDPQGKLRPVYVPQKQAASNIASQYESPQKVQKSEAEINEALRIQAEKNLVLQQQKILEQQPFALDGGKPLMPKNYDPFYSPILEKVDKILNHLGFTDNYCKERVVCSMYKNPSSYTPHSNFISAELSRDTSDLERPQTTNEAVIRFFRLIQAARNGQEQKNCLVLYPQCTIKTE